ncbi:MAG: NUDIX domain-containing protein [Candidatus Symbiothrix sp.]|jgi:isopentenyl-diphosphate delta-isomerase|nr:NUDIX domain-containing protein [Candidatus Symbiothrix sp.]
MVLLVDGKQYDKLKAHQLGLAHYAFSTFVFNSRHELLLQKRAVHKYHSGGLWSNTCCSHPLTSDLTQIKKIAENRLEYEMGISCALEYLFEFQYKSRCGKLTENEQDYVFIGYSDQTPCVNTDEVCDYKCANLEHIIQHKSRYPHEYTPWLHAILDEHYVKLNAI